MATSKLTQGQGSQGFSVQAATGLILSLLGLFVLLVGFTFYQARLDAQRRAFDRAFAASQVVATNAFWISELSRQALQRIDDALGPALDTRRSGSGANIREAVNNLPGIVKAYVVSVDGTTLYSTDPEFKPIDIRDRPYFSALADGQPWYVSPLLVSRLNGQQIFVFSKRLERAGDFVGAAIISYDVALFRDIWTSLSLDQGSTVSLVREDGMLVARFPFAESALDLSGGDLFKTYLPGAPQGTYLTISPADGVQRFVGYRKVDGTPFIALASISATAAFQQFWRIAFVAGLVLIPASGFILVATVWIIRLLRRDAERQAALAEALETNRMLLRDIHHRVKNNLQSVQSLVRMQAIPANVKMDLQARIAAMSAVHEHLYRLDQYTEVNAQSLIPAIVEPLITSSGKPVIAAFDVDPIAVDRDHATPLALLVNELVTNALKYAFADRGGGRIEISLKPIDELRGRLVVSDDGVGFDPEAVEAGMGSRLIRAMTAQLGGTSAYANEKGTRYTADLNLRLTEKQAAVAAAAE